MNDLEMIKKIHEILILLWTFKVAMFSFITALRGLGPSQLMTLAGEPDFFFVAWSVDLGDNFHSQKLHVSPVYFLLVRNVMR